MSFSYNFSDWLDFGIVENLYGDRKTIKKNSVKALK